MTTTTKQQNVLVRAWNRFTQIAEAVDYDSTQYTYDRMASLQAEFVDVKVRVTELEANHNKTASERREDAA